jgi:putative FmdB family regulatory protein
MALYEYKCGGCEEKFDLMRPMSEADEPAQCPECGGDESYRLISNFSSAIPGASAMGSTNPIMDARIASGNASSRGGCCGGSCCG